MAWASCKNIWLKDIRSYWKTSQEEGKKRRPRLWLTDDAELDSRNMGVKRRT